MLGQKGMNNPTSMKKEGAQGRSEMNNEHGGGKIVTNPKKNKNKKPRTNNQKYP